MTLKINRFIMFTILILIILSGCSSRKETAKQDENSNDIIKPASELADYSSYEGCEMRTTDPIPNRDYDKMLKELKEGTFSLDAKTIGAVILGKPYLKNLSDCISILNRSNDCRFLECILNQAILGLDEEECESLPQNVVVQLVTGSHSGPPPSFSVNYRSACLFQIKIHQRIKNEEDFCGKIKLDDEWYDPVQDECVKQRLLYSPSDNPISDCKEYYSDWERFDCIRNIAIKNKDPSICAAEFETSSEEINQCYRAVELLAQ